jgi:hypothetical protein
VPHHGIDRLADHRLVQQRQARQYGQRILPADAACGGPGRVHSPAMERRVRIGMLQKPRELHLLQRANVLGRKPLRFFEFAQEGERRAPKQSLVERAHDMSGKGRPHNGIKLVDTLSDASARKGRVRIIGCSKARDW